MTTKGFASYFNRQASIFHSYLFRNRNGHNNLLYYITLISQLCGFTIVPAYKYEKLF